MLIFLRPIAGEHWVFSVAPVGRPVIGEQLIDRRTDAISMANDSVLDA